MTRPTAVVSTVIGAPIARNRQKPIAQRSRAASNTMTLATEPSSVRFPREGRGHREGQPLTLMADSMREPRRGEDAPRNVRDDVRGQHGDERELQKPDDATILKRSDDPRRRVRQHAGSVETTDDDEERAEEQKERPVHLGQDCRGCRPETAINMTAPARAVQASWNPRMKPTLVKMKQASVLIKSGRSTSGVDVAT
jgi:hypothetical protein